MASDVDRIIEASNGDVYKMFRFMSRVILRMRSEQKLMMQPFKHFVKKRQALVKFLNYIRKRLLTLYRSEWDRQHSKNRMRKSTFFIADPFYFTMKQSG